MSLLFLDTSALIKLYITETGSTWLQNLVAGNQLVISELALYECATVLRRHYLEGNLTLVESSELYASIQQASQNFNVILLRSENQLERVIQTVFSLPTGLRLRALDAIHLAAAQVVQEAAQQMNPPETVKFISADKQFLQVAQAQGFTTDNPEEHL